MGNEQKVLPPPAGTPVGPPLAAVTHAVAPPAPPGPPPPAPPTTPRTQAPTLGAQHRGQGAQVGATAHRRDTPLVAVVRQRGPHGWFKVVFTWLVLGGLVVAGVKLYPRVKEHFTLDSARVSASTDGFLVEDGVVSFRIPARPHKILVHPAGDARAITGFRITIDSGTLDVDVKNTAGARTPTALQRFCDVQFEHRSSTLGPAINDSSGFAEGIYRRSASWHQGEKFVLATCIAHSHSNVFIEATTLHERWPPYAQAVETTSFGT